MEDGGEGEGDLEKIIDEFGADYLLELLQSEDADVLAEIENNPNLVDILQQLQDGTTDECQNSNSAENETQPSAGETEAETEKVKADSVDDDIVEIEVETEEIVPEPAPIVIIQSEGITVCHDGGESLRPKGTSPVKSEAVASKVFHESKVCTVQNLDKPEPVPSTSKQSESVSAVEIKQEKSESHHKHKDKKKDKEKRHKDKEKKKNDGGRPARHPDFAKYKKKFNLLDTSVTIVKIETIIPVERHMRLKWRRLNRIQELDRNQQRQINQKEGKIRLVPTPQSVNAPPYKPEKSANKRPADKHKDKDKDSKRKKIFVVSDSDSDGESSKKKPKKSEHSKVKTKPQVHGEFSATGARILPFEKRPTKDKDKEKAKEQAPIRRPKMPEKEPEWKSAKDKKRDRLINSIGGSKEGEDRVKQLLQQAIRDKERRKEEFRIPKSHQISEVDRGRAQVTTSTPLHRIRQEEKLNFNRAQNNNFNRPMNPANYPTGSYGHHRSQQNPYFGGFDPGHSDNIPDCIEEKESRAAAEELKHKLAMRMRGDADFDEEEDDNPVDMHDDAMSDIAETVPPPEILPPIDDLKISSLVLGVSRLLQTSCEYPSHFSCLPNQVIPGRQEPSLMEVTLRKLAWWFQGVDKTLVPPILPVPINPEIDDTTPPSDDGNGSVVSSFGNVSNPGNNECQIYEITSSDQERAKDPDVKDEFCGCGLINAEFRISADDKFQRIFDVKPGSSYEKEKFNATCTICNEAINGKRDLGRHLRGENHRINFKKISLNIMPGTDRKEYKFLREETPPERVARDPSQKVKADEKSKDKERSSSNGKGRSGSKDTSSRGKEDRDKKERDSKKRSGSYDRERRSSHRRSRSRSRSPDRDRHRRRRQRSPYRRRSRSRSKSKSPEFSRRNRRSTSAERVAEFLAKTTARTRRSRSRSSDRKRIRPASDKSKKPSIFTEKLKLQAAGKWTDTMEAKWRLMEKEEIDLSTEMQGQRKRVHDRPEDHPKYNAEWEDYWGKTYGEVQTKGHNPDTYDYRPGWKIFWGKRVEELLEEEQSVKLEAIQVKYGLDYGSLQRLLLDIQVAPVPIPQPEVVMVPVPILGKEIYTPFEDDFIARSMSLSGASSHNSQRQGPAEPVLPGVFGGQADKPVPKVTPIEIMKTWEKLTGIGTTPKSDHSEGSRSGGNLDLDMDLIQVLRLMDGLEDQLSILAPQIHEYFLRAEAMEQIQPRRSYDLLEDKEFVGILFQCRDKFMGLIKANVLDHAVHRRVNKAVFGLNGILDTEPCQRLRPKPATEVTTPSLELIVPAFGLEWVRRPEKSHALGTPKEVKPKVFGQLELPPEGVVLMERIKEAFRDVSDRRKIEIADIISRSLASAMKLSLSDLELVQHIYDLLRPAMNKLHLLIRSERSPSPVRLLEVQREAVRGIGTALPVLPEIQCRAISPPVAQERFTVQQFQRLRRDDQLEQRQGRGSSFARGQGSMSPHGRGYSPIRGRAYNSMSPRGRGSSSMLPRGRGRGSLSPGRGHSSSSRGSSPYSVGADTRSLSMSPRSQAQGQRILPHGVPSQEIETERGPQPPQPGPSRQNVKEAENIPPKPKKVKAKRKERRGTGLAQEFWKSDNSSVSSESLGGTDWGVDLKKGSKSTTSNGSGSRSQLKEVQVLISGTEAISDAESGEIVSSEEDKDDEKFKPLTEEQKQRIRDRLAAVKKVDELLRNRTKKKSKSSRQELEDWFKRRSLNSKKHKRSRSRHHRSRSVSRARRRKRKSSPSNSDSSVKKKKSRHRRDSGSHRELRRHSAHERGGRRSGKNSHDYDSSELETLRRAPPRPRTEPEPFRCAPPLPSIEPLSLRRAPPRPKRPRRGKPRSLLGTRYCESAAAKAELESRMHLHPFYKGVPIPPEFSAIPPPPRSNVKKILEMEDGIEFEVVSSSDSSISSTLLH